jgi:hypothetical protein
MILTGLLILAVAAVLTLTAVVLVGRTAVAVCVRDGAVTLGLTVAGGGIIYDGGRRRVGLAIRKRGFFYHSISGKKKPQTPSKEKTVKPRKKGRRLPVSTGLKIARAGFLLAIRFLSRLRLDDEYFEWRPVVTDPALAGITYGMSRAVYGIFPALANKVNFVPAFGPGDSHYEGRLAVSIANRQMVVLICRFVRDLPIREVFKVWISKRGER